MKANCCDGAPLAVCGTTRVPGARAPEPTGVTGTPSSSVPRRLLDVVTGDLLTDRAVVVEGDRIAAVVAAPRGAHRRHGARPAGR